MWFFALNTGTEGIKQCPKRLRLESSPPPITS
jgi:hypothetical protein